MPRWDTRVRIAVDWTVSLLFRPDLTKVDLAPEREMERRRRPAGVSPSERLDAIQPRAGHHPLGALSTCGDEAAIFQGGKP